MESIQKELWNGLIPVEFCMDIADIASNSHVESHFMLVSRFAFLYEVTKDTVRHFQNHAIEISSLVWFESNGTELKHYLPIGVLYDAYFAKSSNLSHRQNESTEAFHPWGITIHFQKPIHGPLTVVPANETQRTYFHTLKQSLHQLYGSASLFNQLTIENQNTVWHSINHGDLTQYLSLLPTLSPENEDFKNIPLRLITTENNNHNNNGNNGIHLITRQKSVKPYLNEDTQEQRTLFQVLQEDYQISTHLIECSQLIIQGIVVGNCQEIPIKSFYQCMRHGDFYLYVLLISR
jgi:hypothetical protein